MHFNLVDAYHEAESPIHALDARLKVVMAVGLILLLNLTPMGAFGAYIAFFAIMMAGALAAGIDPGVVVGRSLVAVPFALAAVTLVFTMPGPMLATVPVLGWPISEPGLVRFVSILLKSWISVQAAVLLISTTHFTDMLWALSALHVPKVLVAVISFMYRYIFVLVEEAVRLTRARDSRSATTNGEPPLLFRIQTTGRMIGNLFIRSVARSERVYQAMVSRGYQGELRQLSPPPLRARQVTLTVLTLGAGALILAAAVLFDA
jgi:cobalt/nickel transport system permease protein